MTRSEYVCFQNSVSSPNYLRLSQTCLLCRLSYLSHWHWMTMKSSWKQSQLLRLKKSLRSGWLYLARAPKVDAEKSKCWESWHVLSSVNILSLYYTGLPTRFGWWELRLSITVFAVGFLFELLFVVRRSFITCSHWRIETCIRMIRRVCQSLNKQLYDFCKGFLTKHLSSGELIACRPFFHIWSCVLIVRRFDGTMPKCEMSMDLSIKAIVREALSKRRGLSSLVPLQLSPVDAGHESGTSPSNLGPLVA